MAAIVFGMPTVSGHLSIKPHFFSSEFPQVFIPCPRSTCTASCNAVVIASSFASLRIVMPWEGGNSSMNIWGVRKSWGYPHSWMVYFMEISQTKMDDNQGYPYFRKPPEISQITKMPWVEVQLRVEHMLCVTICSMLIIKKIRFINSNPKAWEE